MGNNNSWTGHCPNDRCSADKKRSETLDFAESKDHLAYVRFRSIGNIVTFIESGMHHNLQALL